MSEELVQPEIAAPVLEAPAPAPKSTQYLLMIDEVGASFLGRICPGIQFVQVEGINMKGNTTHMALVSPMAAPVLQPVPLQASEAPKVD